MRLLSRVKALEKGNEDGCLLCRGRVVAVTHYPPDWRGSTPESEPAGGAPHHICPACGRDFGLHLRVEYEEKRPRERSTAAAG